MTAPAHQRTPNLSNITSRLCSLSPTLSVAREAHTLKGEIDWFAPAYVGTSRGAVRLSRAWVQTICFSLYTSVAYNVCMRTNINIDDRLLSQARKLTRLRTKREIVNRALEVLVQSEARKGILRFRGSGIWEGNLNTMRRNRV